ncbi:MAG: hypothetical protein M1426_03410, partial [Patescibacteria group bacterium]|nr:hypothetical protein [Patescibacteria group bacterium]
MAGQIDSPVEKATGDALITIRTNMMEGNFDDAKRIERESLVPPHIILTIANSVFDSLMLEREFLRSIELARKYELPVNRINDAVVQQFRALQTQNEYEKALEWAFKNGIQEHEINRAAIKWIEYSILQGDVTKAVKVKAQFHISHEQIGGLWQQGYDKAFEQGRFFDAALLSREFGSSERKTILTAAKAFKKAIMEDDKESIIGTDREFRFFNEDFFSLLGDEEAKSVVEAFQNYLRTNLQKGESKKILEIVDGVRVLYSPYINHHLKGLVSFIYKEGSVAHGILLDMDRYDDAKQLRDDLALYEDKVPSDLRRRINDQALQYHNKIMLSGSLEQAKKIKDDYQLLGIYTPAESLNLIQETAGNYFAECVKKGEFKKASFILEEYNLPQEEVLAMITDSLKSLLEEEKFNIAFEVLLKYKIQTNDEEIRDTALKAFEKCMERGYYEIAADLGYVFELNIPRIKEAAKIVWERLMEAEDYQKARAVKRKHKLVNR